MSQNPRIPFQADLRLLSIGPEASYRLGDCIETARISMKPRTFAEDFLVEEMAISRWRSTRVKIMEKSAYDRQALTFRPRSLKCKDGTDAEPYEDMYHLAAASASSPQTPDSTQVVLAALGRLEARYFRHFCAAFRLLLASRRGTPHSVPDENDTLFPASSLRPQWSNESNQESDTQSKPEKESK